MKTKHARKEAKRLIRYGTKARHAWWHEQTECACGGTHHACTGGIDPSHTITVASGGTASDIIRQSRGCHDYIGSKGWTQWEFEAEVDRFREAHEWTLQGPDRPGPGHPYEVPNFNRDLFAKAMADDGATPDDMAALLGVGRETIYMFQNAHRNPRLEHMYKICKWSGYSMTEMLDEVEP